VVVAVGSNIYSVTWNTIYNVLSGNVTDPQIVGVRKSNARFFMMSDYPDAQANFFPGWPILTIEPITSTTSQATFSQSPLNENSVGTSIWMFSRSSRELDILSDNVRNALLTNRQAFANSGLGNLNITNTSNDIEFHGNDRIHTKRMDIELRAVTN